MTTLVPAFMMRAAFPLRVSHRVDSVSVEEEESCTRVSYTPLVLLMVTLQVLDCRSAITPENT